MNSKIFVNCDKLSESMFSFADIVNEINISRKKMLEVINSVFDDWSGIDSQTYINIFSNYLNGMEEDVNYLNEWTDYLKIVSVSFGAVLEDNYKRLKNINLEFENNIGDRYYEEQD